MATCTDAGDSSCSVESDDDSDSAVEGQWFGLSIGMFFLLIFIAWLCRTLSSPQRRLQLISKLHHCCKVKSSETGDMGYPSTESNGNLTPRRNSSARSSLDRRSTSSQDGGKQAVIYYKPTIPALGRAVIPRAGVSVPTELDHFGHYHTENEDGDGAKSFTHENGGPSIPGRPRPRHARGMKKSRSTVSMTSCNLAPIQEVDDGADSEAIQRVQEKVTDGIQEGQLTASPLSSRSHPDRLASLAVHSDDYDRDDDDDDNVFVKKYNNKITDSTYELDAKSVGDKPEEITVEILSQNGNGGSVNFVYGSDDEESNG